jgi:hypothetical protein
MSELKVGSVTIPELLSQLHSGRLVVPAFQREFVWTTSQIEELASSILRQRPIGLATLWEVAATSDGEAENVLGLENVSLPEDGPLAQFGEPAVYGDRLAILDGRQRCTAIAMVFGTLQTKDGRRRGSGRFFFNLDEPDSERLVQFKSHADIEKHKLDAPASALRQGLMPLEIKPPTGDDWNPFVPWNAYVKLIATDEIYSSSDELSTEDRDRRIERIELAQVSLQKIQLATYTLPSSYDLSDICEIFETLNSTGVQVSTVDLIHTFIFQDTALATPGVEPLSIRGWIKELGGTPGAVNWASSDEKPERVAQMVTAAYVGLESRPDARKLPGGRNPKVSSIKAPDLLRTPTAHWRVVASQTDEFAALIGAFQLAVAGNCFPMKWCPYPAVASVYMGIAWSKSQENVAEDAGWSMGDLDSLIRAFFWRNALTGRYDQGFLTKVGTDIHDLRALLRRRVGFASSSAWLQKVEKDLQQLIGVELPTLSELQQWCTDASLIAGARRDAVRLLLWTNTTNDLVTQDLLPLPGTGDVELHHLWPKKWLSDNKNGKLAAFLDEAKDEKRDVINCAANLVPLLAGSNKDWKAKNPGTVLLEHVGRFENCQSTMERAFINREIFGLLTRGAPADYESAVKARGKLIAKAIMDQTRLTT